MVSANASLIYPDGFPDARISQREFAPMGSASLSEIAPERCGYVPSDAYEYDEFPELTPRIAPPPSGGVSLVRLAAWLLPPSLVLGVVAWVVTEMVR